MQAMMCLGGGLVLLLFCLRVEALLERAFQEDARLERKLQVDDGLQKEAASGELHSFTLGTSRPGEKLLYMDNPKHSYKFLRIASTDVKFPPKNTYAKGIITFIRVTDLKGKGKGGYAYLEKGGIGYKYAHFHIKSQRNHGYDFLIEVYGDTY